MYAIVELKIGVQRVSGREWICEKKYDEDVIIFLEQPKVLNQMFREHLHFIIQTLIPLNRDCVL